MDAVFLTSLFFGCEGWFGENLRGINTSYMSALKYILNVRTSTRNDLVMIECGYPEVNALVKGYQRNTYQKLLFRNQSIHDDPFKLIIEITDGLRQTEYIKNLAGTSDCFKDVSMENIKTKIRNCNGSKAVAYKLSNPLLSVHDVYSRNKFDINEHKRVAFTRFRLSAHNLNIERGRWVRPITPIDRRLCECGNFIQNEEHVLKYCNLTGIIRSMYPQIIFELPEFMNHDTKTIVNIIYEILRTFDPIT